MRTYRDIHPTFPDRSTWTTLIVDELPKTPSERVRKIKLREQGVTATTHDRADYP